jgi:uncharacterized protein with NRDE domain
MCLLLVAKNSHPKFKFILAANRDEFYNRESLPAYFWKEYPSLLAGKDLKEGGTWLGITKSGKLAAITNYRDIRNLKNNAPSRGMLTLNFLINEISPQHYYEKLESNGSNYNGYNLIFGNLNQLFYFSNVSKEFKELQNGIYGLSNSLLDVPWAKVEQSKERLSVLLSKPSFEMNDLFDILFDETTADDDTLPDTGLSIDLERILSAIFIKTQGYGTRSSTIILVNKKSEVAFIEKTYHPESDNFTTKDFNFTLDLI